MIPRSKTDCISTVNNNTWLIIRKDRSMIDMILGRYSGGARKGESRGESRDLRYIGCGIVAVHKI